MEIPIPFTSPDSMSEEGISLGQGILAIAYLVERRYNSMCDDLGISKLSACQIYKITRRVILYYRLGFKPCYMPGMTHELITIIELYLPKKLFILWGEKRFRDRLFLPSSEIVHRNDDSLTMYEEIKSQK